MKTRPTGIPFKTKSRTLTASLTMCVLAWSGAATAFGATFISFTSPTYSVLESGGNATITVHRAGNPHGSVAVSFAASNGSATSGLDYTSVTGTVVFTSGQRIKTFTVPILNDLLVESNETIVLTLSNPTGGAKLHSPKTSVLVIIDNDATNAPPNLSIDNFTSNEGNSGTTPMVFQVNLSSASASTVTVAFATEDGDALAGTDYISQSGTLVFNPGETNKTITVSVIGNTLNEPDKVLFVNLSNPVGATVAPAQGIGTILNDDGPAVLNDSYSTWANTPLIVAAPGVLANDTDASGSSLTATLVTPAANGTLTLNADGSFMYTPNSGFSGSDNFTYQASDGAVDSEIATATIAVGVTNQPPVAIDDSYSATEDTALIVPASSGVLSNDTDADGNPLTAVLVSPPENGTLVFNQDGSFTYTPDPYQHGTDTFTYQVNDGIADSSIGTVTITVAGVEGAGDVDLYAASAFASINWAGHNAGKNSDRFRIQGKINPAGCAVNLNGATVAILLNGVPVGAPVTLNAAGRGVTPQGVAPRISARLSSSTGRYIFSASDLDLRTALTLANATEANSTVLDVQLVVNNASLDVPVMEGHFETPYKTVKDRASLAKFAFRRNRTLTGVFNCNRTVATQVAGGFKLSFSGVMENEGGEPVVPTGAIKITIGDLGTDTVLVIPMNSLTSDLNYSPSLAAAIPGLAKFSLHNSNHSFRIVTTAINPTGMPLTGPGATTVQDLPLLIEVPVASGTNVFGTVIELKRHAGTSPVWVR